MSGDIAGFAKARAQDITTVAIHAVGDPAVAFAIAGCAHLAANRAARPFPVAGAHARPRVWTLGGGIRASRNG